MHSCIPANMATEIQTEMVKVGDIFYESWGYDQTQNDFCQVARR